MLGHEHEVIPSEFDEYAVRESDFTDAAEYVKAVSAGKVLEVSTRISPEFTGVILGGDLMAFVDGQVFHKPKSYEEARAFIEKFANTWHDEIAAISAWSAEKGLTTQAVTARVFTPPLTEKEIDLYLQTANPLDKAGGYSMGGISRILGKTRTNELHLDGKISTVLGLPFEIVVPLLEQYGYPTRVDVARVEQDVARSLLASSSAQSGQDEAITRKMKI